MRRRAVITPDIKAKVVQQYTTRLPDGTWKGSKLISRDLGISDATVRNILNAEGVPIRTNKEAHAHGKRCGPFKHMAQFGEPALCACGCGQPTHWLARKYRWAKYVDDSHWHKPKPHRDAAWLRAQYVNARRNASDIAAECEVHTTTIIRFLEKFGIERRTTQESLLGVQAGERNPAWRGGTTPERQRLYKTQEWKAVVRSVYARDGYTCQRCKEGVSGNKKRGATAHHIKSWAGHPELRRDMSNIITLCRTCHEWVHSLANTSRDFIK